MPTSSFSNQILTSSSNYSYYNLTGYTLANSNIGTLTTFPYTYSTPYINGTITTVPQYTYTYDSELPQNPLKKLNYQIIFLIEDVNKRYFLEKYIKGVRKNKILFNCQYAGNRIQPYELIMKLIETQEKFSVKVHISDILSIYYTNFQFLKIENNLDFNSDCDFSVLKVKFKYEKIIHENLKLSEKELRADKLKKIIENNE